jgi:hypothetical protein
LACAACTTRLILFLGCRVRALRRPGQRCVMMGFDQSVIMGPLNPCAKFLSPPISGEGNIACLVCMRISFFRLIKRVHAA